MSDDHRTAARLFRRLGPHFRRLGLTLLVLWGSTLGIGVESTVSDRYSSPSGAPLPDGSRVTLFTYNFGGEFRETEVPLVFRSIRETGPYTLSVVIGVEGEESSVRLTEITVSDALGTRQVTPKRDSSDSGRVSIGKTKALHRHLFMVHDCLEFVGRTRVDVAGAVRRGGGEWQPFSMTHENESERLQFYSTGWFNVVVFGDS